MNRVRTTHRVVASIILVFLMFLGITGLVIQGYDFRALLTHASAYDPVIQSIHEGIDGLGEFQVKTTSDYDAPALPAGLDLHKLTQNVYQAARKDLGNQPFRFVELRMKNGQPVGQVLSNGTLETIDPFSGKIIGKVSNYHEEFLGDAQSTRNIFKHIHRMTVFGKYAMFINVFVGLGLIVMVCTGLAYYFQLLNAHTRSGQRAYGIFWIGYDGSLESLKHAAHRLIGLCGAVFILAIALSGEFLAYESLYFALTFTPPPMPQQGPQDHAMAPPTAISPLQDDQVDGMLRVTLDAEKEKFSNRPIKILRLRNFANYPQGVLVMGGDETWQYVFNASTGKAMSESAPGYPPNSFPFGWQAHQTAKAIHRGDYFGMPGRWAMLFGGLCMTYLCINGLALLWDLRKQRITDRN